MGKIQEYWLRFYAWCRSQPWGEYYSKFKLWLREKPIGRALDRFFRFFLITLVGTFAANWVAGAPVLPVLQSAFGVAIIATIDKLKNELLAWSRSVSEDDITYT